MILIRFLNMFNINNLFWLSNSKKKSKLLFDWLIDAIYG